MSRRTFTKLAAACAGGCVMGTTGSLLSGCSCSSQTPEPSTLNPSDPSYTFVSPYDFNGFSRETGRLEYHEGDTLCSMPGIDVAEHQGTIDWEAVAADGIEFAIVRVGNRGMDQGFIDVDEQFEANLAGAKQAGIAVGVYFFSQAITVEEAVEEADFVLKKLDGTKLEFPVVFDEEVTAVNGLVSRAANCSKQQLTDNALAFCERIEAAGYVPMIYGNSSDVSKLDMSRVSHYDFWFAAYNERTPNGKFNFVMWQYSNDGTVAGIDAAVDMNIYFTAACANRPSTRLTA